MASDNARIAGELEATMELAGFWTEQDWGFGALPSLAESVEPEPQPDEQLVVGYLECAAPLMIAATWEPDLLDPASDHWSDSQVLTDGTWLWPASLSYYVRTYHVRVPERFRAHMASNGWQPQPMTEDDLAAISDQAIEAMERVLRPPNRFAE